MSRFIFENVFKLRFIFRQMLFLIYLIIFFLRTLSITKTAVKSCSHQALTAFRLFIKSLSNCSTSMPFS